MNMRIRRALHVSLVCLVGLLPASPLMAQPADNSMETVAIVAVSSYDDLISDINFMGGLADMPEAGQMVEGMIAMFTQMRGLAGIDKSKPWGVLLETDGMQFRPIGCLPVTDASQLTGLLTAFDIDVQDVGDGMRQIQGPDGPPIFVKESGGWVYISNTAESLGSVPANPSQQFATLTKEYDLGARVAVQKIPAEYRKLAIEQLRAGLEEGLEREPGEDEQTYQLRKKWSQDVANNMVRLFEEMDEITVGWALDAEKQRMFADLVTKVIPGSRMSRQFKSIAANSRTNFAGFYQPDAAACFTFVQKTDPELIRDDIQQLKTMLVTVREQVNQAIDEEEELPDEKTRQALKDAAGDFIDAFEATVETGHMEGGAVLNLSPDALTVVAGGHVVEPDKIDSGIKKIIAVAKEEPDFPGIAWNAESHAGINFHTIEVPLDNDDEEARHLFGPTVNIAVGIGTESVYLAVGRDNMTAVKGVIDASRSQPDKQVPPSELMISLAPIMEVAAEFADKDQERRITGTVAQMLRNEAQGRDHIRMVTQTIENGQRIRIEVEEGVLRALGKAASAAQQAAAANGF